MTRILITGHSRGLGAALARSALRRGAEVWGLARRPLSPPPAAAPGLFRESPIDLRDLAALHGLVASPPFREWCAHDRTFVLVNNAGVLGPVGPVGRLDEEAIAHAVALDLVAPLVLTNAFVRATKNAADRRVVHVSSGAARHPVAGWAVYCACKAALDHHARTAAAEGVRGLRIASVAPGVIDTDMQAEVRGLDPENFPESPRFHELHRRGLLVAPEDAAERFLDYVLSDAFGAETAVDLRRLSDGVGERG
jgi:benzil reductase ((S)-benzoin forming)